MVDVQNLFPGVAQLVARLLWEQDAASSSLATRTKNPECESIQDFYFLPFHSSLFTKTTLNGAVLLDKYFDIIVLFQNNH